MTNGNGNGNDVQTNSGAGAREMWELTLFVAGPDGVSQRARDHLERIRGEHLEGHCRIEVVDILNDPEQARAFDIVATPTLLRRHPKPERRVIGDLSITVKVLAGLGL